MPKFSVNPHRIDPYKNFKFRLKWDNKVVAAVSKMSPLKRVTDVITYREGGDQNIERKSPGKTHFEPIILERGITHDLEFEAWANLSFNYAGGGHNQMALKNFRKDIRIELLNESGQIVMAYIAYRCWVSEYVALPELNSGTNAIAIESIKLENEGWIRDTSVNEPAEN